MRARIQLQWLSAALAFFPAMLSGQTRQRLEITVDPRVELLSIVQVLGQRMDNGQDFPYKRAVVSWFGPYRDHAAVQRIRGLVSDRLSWGIPAALGVRLSPLPGLRASEALPTDLAMRPLDRDSVEAYVAAVRDFARVTHFDRFFARHRPFYDSLVSATRATMGSHDWLGDVEQFYGWRQAGYHIYLSPLMPAGGVGPRLAAPGGQFEVFSILGVHRVTNGLPVFGSPRSLRALVLHEFSHSFVNPVIEANGAAVERYGLLLYPLRNRLRQADGLQTWTGAVQEFVIRGFTSNVTAALQGDSAGQAERDRQKELGFEYIDAFAERLREYASRRDRYATFRDFYPRLEALFAELAADSLGPARFERPFGGNIAMARWTDENMFFAFIVPTADRDPALQDSLHALVRQIRDRNYPASFIVQDKDALNQDLSRYAIWAFGTLHGNLWLRSHRDAIPARIEADRIIADSAYEGQGLVLVSALPNPANGHKPLLVSTGQRIEEVSRAFWLWDADWAVMEGTTRRGIGTYTKKEGIRWSFR